MHHNNSSAAKQTSLSELPVEILSHIAISLNLESATNLALALPLKIISSKFCIYEIHPGTHPTLTANLKTPNELFWETFQKAVFYRCGIEKIDGQIEEKNFFIFFNIETLIQLSNILNISSKMKNKLERLNNDLINFLDKKNAKFRDLNFLAPNTPKNQNDISMLKYELERLQYAYTALCLFEMDEDTYNSVKRKSILIKTYEIISEYGPVVSGLLLLPCFITLTFHTLLMSIKTIWTPEIITTVILLILMTMLCMPALIDSQRSTHKRIRDEDAWDGWQSSEDENRRHHNRDLNELVDDVRLNIGKTASQARAGIHHSLFVQSRWDSFSLIRKDSKFKSSYTQAAKRAETQIMEKLKPSRV